MTNQNALIGFALSFIAGIATMAIIGKATGDGITPDSKSVSKAKTSVAADGPKNPGAVPVELYIMSQCPYGVEAINGIKPVIEKFGPDVDLKVDYIGQEEGGNLTAMHGESEVKGNIAQLCAFKHIPAKAMAFIACQNENWREVDTNWDSCGKKVEADMEVLKTCIEGSEGKSLLSASYKRAQAKGASGSPTIYVGGQQYSGRRTDDAYTRAICNGFADGKAPEICKALPDQPTVNVMIISDKRCADCNTAGLEQGVGSRIGKPNIRKLDYGDPEGRQLFEAVKGEKLPLLVFDETLDADKEASETLGRGARREGKYRVLNVGGKYNPICGEPNSCSKPECQGEMSCRPETKNTLEVFVMSQCPFGVRALDAMEEVLKNFGSALNFKVHFIANGTAAGGFQALHGQPEVDENIRQLCAIKHYPNNHKYMDYILCRNKNIRSDDWQSCTGSNGIAKAKIQSCFDGEGKKLHEEDIKIANGMGIGASPSWIVNGKHQFSGIDAETVRQNVCQHNPGMKGCENRLSGGQPGGAPAGGCQ